MKSEIKSIKGDASFRTFYRFIQNKKSKIIVLSKKENYKNLIAYTAINKFLRKKKILCPKLYDYNLDKGIVIIEDFGDLTYHKFLQKKKYKFTSYKNIVDLLIKIQKIKPVTKIKNITPKSHIVEKYSNKILHQESDLFFDWYLPLFLKKKKVLSIKKNLRKNLSNLYRKLNFPNSYFVHRDFHIENLMKTRNKIGVIDTQDALIGNPAYDLVSLIDDVRIKNSTKLKNQIYNYYLKKTKIVNRLNCKKFLIDFNILSVQRSLKIIGIFARLFKRDQKDKYLKLIPYTWKLLEKRMNSKIFLNLRKTLDDNISQKIRKKLIK